jgi:hypothetical protein
MVSGTYLGIGLELCQDCSYAVVIGLDVCESVGGDGGDIHLVHVCRIDCCIVSAAMGLANVLGLSRQGTYIVCVVMER